MRLTAFKIVALLLLATGVRAFDATPLMSFFQPVASTETDPDVTNGLAVWYRFTDGSGSTITDNSGNIKNATTYNNPAWTGTNAAGYGSMTFTRASSQYAAIPTISCGTNFTISCWIYENSASSVGYQGSVGFRYLGEGAGLYQASIYADQNATAWKTVDIAIGTYASGAWHHYVITHNGSVWSNYYDGVLFGAYTVNGSTVFANRIDRDGVMGRYYSESNQHYLNAKLADVRVYSRMITSNEANKVFNLYGHP